MLTRHASIILASAVLMAPAVTFADPPAVPSVSPSAQQQPQDAAVPIGLVVQRSGGSLFRAESASRASSLAGDADTDARSEAPPGSLAAISFFACEAPKPKTLKKHDLVTIIAKEASAFTSNGNTNLQKQEDYDSKLNAFIALHPSSFKIASVISGATNVPEINFQNNRDYKGTGEVDRTDTFSDRVTAEVVDVKPNGTLVLQAVKQIKTDEEEQRMVLSGICRAADITADNTVLTTQLFDLELTQIHNGAVTDTTSRGLIPRLLDMFSPF